MPNDSTETNRSTRLQRLREQIAPPGPASETPVAPPPATPAAEPPQTQPQQAGTPVPGSAWKGLGQPSSHDRLSVVPFEMRHKKENVMIDKRLLASYYDLMGKLGRSKVEAFNAMLLQVLLDAGYPLDPKLLERPFQWEDLPR